MATRKVHESFLLSLDAAQDLSSNLNYFAKVDTNGKFDLADDGGPVAGVFYEVAAADRGVTVQHGGQGTVVAGENITAGAILASDSAAKAVAAAVGDYVVGIATKSATAGELVPFIFASGRRHA